MKNLFYVFIFIGACTHNPEQQVEICKPDPTNTGCICTKQQLDIDENCISNWINLNAEEKKNCQNQIQNLNLLPQGNITFADNNWWEIVGEGSFDLLNLDPYLTKYGNLTIVCTSTCKLINDPVTQPPVCLDNTKTAYYNHQDNTWQCNKFVDVGASIKLDISEINADGVQINPSVCNGYCNIQCPTENLGCETKAFCMGYNTNTDYTYPNCNY